MPDFAYAGMYQHQPSGNYLSATRLYNPNLGRWLSRDPIEESGGLNMYAYCGNNPINAIDPDGLDFWVEGEVAGEPYLHQRIAVGDPNGVYYAYTFGIDGGASIYLGVVGTDNPTGLGSHPGGTILPTMYAATTPATDAKIKAYLDSLVGTRPGYMLGTTCRDFAQDRYAAILAALGAAATPTKPPATPGRVPYVSPSPYQATTGGLGVGGSAYSTITSTQRVAPLITTTTVAAP